jgi:hypothetical protein
MMVIRFALIAEGSTEKALLGHLKALCLREGVVEVEEIWAKDLLEALDEVGSDIASKVRMLLEIDPSIDLVFIHRDSDARTDEHRRKEIFDGVTDSGHSPPHVPIVPIQETEAWLLLDPAEIRRVVANSRGISALELPKPSQIEQRANPKEILREALHRASKPGRRNVIDKRTFGQLRRELLQNLDIDGPVNQLSAWQNLLRDLKVALAELALPSKSD